MEILKYIYHWFKGLIHSLNSNQDFKSARQELILSRETSNFDKKLLNKVKIPVYYKDTMYKKGKASHYLSLGLSAHRCINDALNGINEDLSVNHILDFACGYGRVLRFLRVAFQNSEITAMDINDTALRFCQRNFKVKTFLSNNKFSTISLSQKFDIIWCGSLFTHIDEESAVSLLRFFYNNLSDHGVCVFSTQGKHSIDVLRRQKEAYGLTENEQRKVLREFQEKGYGYTDYTNNEGYGISIVKQERLNELAKSVGDWNQVMFLERGWDNHQDVYAFEKYVK